MKQYRNFLIICAQARKSLLGIGYGAARAPPCSEGEEGNAAERLIEMPDRRIRPENFQEKIGECGRFVTPNRTAPKIGHASILRGGFRSVVENLFSPIKQLPRGRLSSARLLYRQEWGTRVASVRSLRRGGDAPSRAARRVGKFPTRAFRPPNARSDR